MDKSVSRDVFDPESSQSLKDFLHISKILSLSHPYHPALTQSLPSQRAFADVEIELLVGSQDEKSQITKEYAGGYLPAAPLLLIQYPEWPFGSSQSLLGGGFHTVLAVWLCNFFVFFHLCTTYQRVSAVPKTRLADITIAQD